MVGVVVEDVENAYANSTAETDEAAMAVVVGDSGVPVVGDVEGVVEELGDVAMNSTELEVVLGAAVDSGHGRSSGRGAGMSSGRSGQRCRWLSQPCQRVTRR